MFYFSKKMRCVKGQASVEAAILIPIFFILLLILIQPGILLYNRMVMQSAAAEGCRLLATRTGVVGSTEEQCEKYILRRLGSIPPQDNFHVHNEGCSWEISLQGNETSMTVSVSITNTIRPLPLLGGLGQLLGFVDASGLVTQSVTVETSSQPDWVSKSVRGLDPGAWIEDRIEQDS